MSWKYVNEARTKAKALDDLKNTRFEEGDPYAVPEPEPPKLFERPPRKREPKTRKMDRWGDPMRSIRISDELWETAYRRAQADGISLAEVIRRGLARYAGVKKG